MSEIVWDKTGERMFETGVDHGVLYPMTGATYGTGVAWNGLTSISENPEGAEPTDLWADNIKYATLISAETYKTTIEAYMYPKEFAECDGSIQYATGMTIGQQPRKSFGLCYRTMVGSDTDPSASGYKLHLVYGCTASPSEKSHETVNDSPDAGTFSWEVSTNPVNVTGHKPTATVEIDSATAGTHLADLLKVLYGTANKEPRLPLPDEVKDILTNGVAA